MSQNDKIIKHLQKGRSLTPLQALDRYGCMRLASRIGELRDRGYKIVSNRVKRGGKVYAEYRLIA